MVPFNVKARRFWGGVGALALSAGLHSGLPAAAVFAGKTVLYSNASALSGWYTENIYSAVVHHNGSTYFVMLDSNRRPQVGKITGGTTDLEALEKDYPGYVAFDDGHHEFSIGIDRDGYIHVTGDLHNFPDAEVSSSLPSSYASAGILYWKSANPEDINDFDFVGNNSAQAIPGENFSYGHFERDRNGMLYYVSRTLARQQYWQNGGRGLGLYVYDEGSKSWTARGAPAPISDASHAVVAWEQSGQNGGSYQQYKGDIVFDENNRMYLTSGMNTQNGSNQVNAIIFAYSDDGGVTFRRMDGSAITLPMQVAPGSRQADVVDVDVSAKFEQPRITYAFGNAPVIQYSVWSSQYYKYWTGSAWSGRTTSPLSTMRGWVAYNDHEDRLYFVNTQGGTVYAKDTFTDSNDTFNAGETFRAMDEYTFQKQNVVYGMSWKSSTGAFEIFRLDGLVSPSTQTPTPTPPGGWQSSQVWYQGSDLAYAEDGEGNRIPDFSHAGYREGCLPIPDVPEVMSIGPVAGDDTANIQAAIDAVGAMPLQPDGFRGALKLQPGTYEIGGKLTISTDGVVLRGSGDGTNPAVDTILVGDGPDWDINSAVLSVGKLGVSNWKSTGSQVNITTNFVKAWHTSFQVASTAGFSVGDEILIRHPATDAWRASVNYGDTAGDAGWSGSDGGIVWHRTITDVDPATNTITINSNLFHHLNRSLTQCTISHFDDGQYIERCGVEDLRIDIKTAGGEDENHVASAIEVTQIQHAWVRRCSFRYHWHSGVVVKAASYVTVSDCRASDMVGTISGQRGYNFSAEEYTNLILFTRNDSRDGRHNYISSASFDSNGIVFHDSISANGKATAYMEGHFKWSMGMLFDSIDHVTNQSGRVLGIYNRGDYGTAHGWSCANCVAWNVDANTNGDIIVQKPPTAQNWAIGCFGDDITGQQPAAPFGPHPDGHIEGSNSPGLFPSSLYSAQLADRLCSVVVPPTPTDTPTAVPTPFAVPGRIEAEDYHAYSDTTAGNTGGEYRFDDVDIQSTTDVGGGYNVGWSGAGEYLEWTLDIVSAGDYQIVLRTASDRTDPQTLDLSLDGSPLVTGVSVPPTGGWQVWSDVTAGTFSLPAGQHTLRLSFTALGINLNYLDILPASTPTGTMTRTPTRTLTGTATGTPSPSQSPSATLTTSPTSSATLSVTPSLSTTPSPTITSTATLTAGPTSTHTETSSQTVTITASVTPTLDLSSSPTPTATQTFTPTFTEIQSMSPSASPTGTATVSRTATPTATSSRTASVTSTPTPTSSSAGSPVPSVTTTTTPDSAAELLGLDEGTLGIVEAFVAPNPVVGDQAWVVVQLKGRTEMVTFKIYSAGMTRIAGGEWNGNWKGIVRLALPQDVLSQSSNGLYYCVLRAARGGALSPPKIIKMYIRK